MSHTGSTLSLKAHVEKIPMIHPFHITGYTFTHNELLVVQLHDGEHEGTGEGLGVYYRKDTPYTMLEQVEALRDVIEKGITRKQLLELLPPGGARNALDCALWDLEAKQRQIPVWRLAGLPTPRPLLTTFTLGADAPEIMADEARGFDGVRAIKLKLTDDAFNAQRVRAVREACPDAWMMIDANQGFTRESLAQVLPAFIEARVAVVEQPFPVGCEEWLDGLNCPIPIAVDESVQDHHDLERVLGRAQVVNIKLDKCGGLTEALILAKQAHEMGFKLMVGNMGGTSWSMGPGFAIGALCDVVDLDGPLYLRSDRSPAVTYADGHIWCPDSVWGGPATATA